MAAQLQLKCGVKDHATGFYQTLTSMELEFHWPLPLTQTLQCISIS